MVGRMKKETDDGATPTTTPKKPKAQPRRKKAPVKSEDGEDADNADETGATPTKTPNKRKRAPAKSKEIVEEEDDDWEDGDGLAAEMESPAKKVKEEVGTSEVDTDGW